VVYSCDDDTTAPDVLFPVLSTCWFTYLVAHGSPVHPLPASENATYTGHEDGKSRGAEHGKQYTRCLSWLAG
jgi:hypothetical protein